MTQATNARPVEALIEGSTVLTVLNGVATGKRMLPPDA